MKAFHNKTSVKRHYLARIKAHAIADEIVKGRYWEDGEGCAVGCTIHSDDHTAYETELGIPEWLARIEDRLFEGMPIADAKKWPTQFLSAIKVGADLEKIKKPFLVVILKFSLNQFDHKKYHQAVVSIEAVIKLLKSKKEVTSKQWQEARRNATAAAADVSTTYAAYAAADVSTTAAYAAAAAADADADAATDAVYAATYAVYAATDAHTADVSTTAAYAAARSSAYLYFAKELLKLIRSCK